MKTLKVLGWILVVAGILDFALYYIADVDLTGFSLFPCVATGIGWALIEVAKKKGNNNEDENQGTSDNGDSTKIRNHQLNVDTHASSKPLSAPAEITYFCGSCGSSLPEGVKFCPYCGAPVLVKEHAPNVVESPKDWESYFRNILQKNFPHYVVKENVPVTHLTGDIYDVFKLYKDRPNQVYKAEWGKPYDFVLYSGNQAKAVIMLANEREHMCRVTYLISRMFAKKLNVPYLGFYTKFPNREDYVINRIKENIK